MELKQESYFQPKSKKSTDEASDELEDGEPIERQKKTRHWVDLDRASFEDHDGFVSEEEGGKKVVVGSPADDSSSNKKVHPTSSGETGGQRGPEVEQHSENESHASDEKSDIEYDDDDDDDDAFNTAFVDTITSGQIKFAEIPDDPVYDEAEDDPFNTDIAKSIVKSEEEHRRKAETKLKFSGLNAVADVLSGKSDHLDKSLVDHTVKRKRRRGNRINLIGDDKNEITAVEDIATQDGQEASSAREECADLGFELATQELDVVPEIIKAVEVDLAEKDTQPSAEEGAENVSTAKVDFAEFDAIERDGPTTLTSNVAILSGELVKPAEEETDDFDAAFDALAQESVTKSRLEDLERQFEHDDIFDTSCANKVLNLASLTDRVQETEDLNEDIGDPFDTSAFDHITGEVETDLEFEQLAARSEGPSDLGNENSASAGAVKDIGTDAFGTSGVVSSSGCDDGGWAAFEKKKPPRPVPPRPRQPRAPILSVTNFDPADAPSVVVKAPSTESIKSWNISVAENLIRKAEESSAVEPVLEEEDPFDTTHIESLDKDKEEGTAGDDSENYDPFDTSGVEVVSESKGEAPAEREVIHDSDSDQEEQVPDVIEGKLSTPRQGSGEGNDDDDDPFDTEFASGVLPNKGDPFDTSFVAGEEEQSNVLKSLERECQGNFGRQNSQGTGSERQLQSSVSDVLVEDSEFDPTATFQKSRKAREETEVELDPFDTGIVDVVVGESGTANVAVTQSQEKDSDSDDFDPRA